MSNTVVGTIVPFALTYCAHGWARPLFANRFGHGWKDKGRRGCWASWKQWVGREGQAHPPHDPLHLLQASLAKEIFPFHWLWREREREREVNMKITLGIYNCKMLSNLTQCHSCGVMYLPLKEYYFNVSMENMTCSRHKLHALESWVCDGAWLALWRTCGVSQCYITF